MKVSSVGIFAALGMIFTSFSVWSLTPPAGARPSLPTEPSSDTRPAVAGSDSPSFSRDGALRLEGRLGHAWLPADAPGETFVLANIEAPGQAATGSTPVNLAIVLDRSGSMAGKRLNNALEAARGMVRRLRDGDVVSVIAYDTRAETLVPATTLDGFARERVLAAFSSVRAQGDTCISCGIDAAMEALRSRSGMAQRILLLSDGEPTAGTRDIEGFRRIAATARSMSCPISSIGVDVAYNERLLSALALDSNGKHYFAENDADLSRAFDGELASFVQTVANGAELELDLGQGIELERVFDRAFRREGSRLVVPLGAFSRNEQKTVLVKLRVPRGAEGSLALANLALAFDSSATGRRERLSGSLTTERRAGESVPSPLDAVIQARLGRTETADTLEEANALWKAGDSDGARQKLRAKAAELQGRKAGTAAAPSAIRDSVGRDFDNQAGELDKAEKGFGDAPASAAPGQKPQDSRAGRAAPKRNVEAANPFRH